MHQQPLSLPVSSVVTPNTNNVKQKSLLRKNRQTPAPFELNVPTSIDPSQNRLQQFGDDLSKTFGSVTAPLVNDKNNVMKPNFLEEFKLVIDLIKQLEQISTKMDTISYKIFPLHIFSLIQLSKSHRSKFRMEIM